jgi:hypothetical protein
MISEPSSVELLPRETWHAELAGRPKSTVDWVWPGYLAHGAVTLLTSQWKDGKTTLVSLLLARMARGGELAGQIIRPARVAVATEEPLELWQRRGEKLGFGEELCYFSRPLAGRATLEAWDALVDRMAQLGRERGVDVVILDPLAALLPAGAENQTAAMLQVLSRLSRLTQLGQAVLVLHHPTKGTSTAGQLARGVGALCAFVDILMEMSLLTSALETDRRRRIAAWSRFEETPRQRVIELSEDGQVYLAREESEAEDSFTRHWPAVERLLAFPPRRLTRQELLVAWRAKATAPSPMTLWRILDRAVEQNLLLCEGTGTRSEPYRYWLAELPPQWEVKDDSTGDYWPIVKHLLTSPPRKMTASSLLRNWPQAAGLPHPALLEECLARALADNRLTRQGSGRHGDPLLYFIDGLDAQYRPDYADLLDL